MKPEDLLDRNLEEEFVFSSSRSSGPGGQNINKVNTKVELRFNLSNSARLTGKEKILIAEKLANKINRDGELIIVSQSERSQLKNKNVAIEKFYSLISKALTVRKKRRPTSPTRKSKEDRLNVKRLRSSVKRTRRKKSDSSDD
jgi:ribosome-associated protein